MERTMRGLFLLMLCIMISFGKDTVKNGRIISIRTAENTLTDQTIADEASRNLDLHMERSAAKDICYISYSVETRRIGEGYGKEKEISVVRIVRK